MQVSGRNNIDFQSLIRQNQSLKEEIELLKAREQRMKEHERDLQNAILKLRESEQRFRLLVSSVSDYAIFMLDSNGYIVSWNEGAQRIKGYTADEIIGKHFSTFYTKEDLRANKPANELEIAIKEGKYEEEGIRVRKDGSVFWANVVITAIYDEDQKLIGFAKVTRDLTEKKEAQEMLLELNKELSSSNKELEQFAYVASHDLKEPLRMISSYLQLLERRIGINLDAESKDYINYALEGSKRMNSLINDLLDYSRVGRMHKSLTDIDLNRIIETVKQNLKSSIEESNADIRHSRLPVIQSAEVYMVQLFQNLVSNAIKFRKDNEQCMIKISCEDRPEFWIFMVEDNGIGFDQKFADRIFIIFQRLHERGKYPGTGIGLAICKKIVEMHQGRIWADSKPGVGTTFKFTISKHGFSE